MDAPAANLRNFAPALPLNAAQRSVHARISRRVEAFGPRPMVDASCLAQRGVAADVLAFCKKHTPGLQFLFPVELHVFEQKFQQAMRLSHLAALHATPHCLRHGGPSTDFALKFRSLEEIQRRGRWRAHASVRRYEKAGRLNKQLAVLSPAQLEQAKRDALALPTLLMRL